MLFSSERIMGCRTKHAGRQGQLYLDLGRRIIYLCEDNLRHLKMSRTTSFPSLGLTQPLFLFQGCVVRGSNFSCT